MGVRCRTQRTDERLNAVCDEAWAKVHHNRTMCDLAEDARDLLNIAKKTLELINKAY